MSRPAAGARGQRPGRWSRRLVLGPALLAPSRLDRVRGAAWPVLQAALGAATAFLLAQRLLGHPHPFFAAVACFVCLGLTDERRLRRVLELAVGVTTGVALGDLFVLGFGSGPVQIAVALASAVLLAVYLHGGQLAATQAGVQAVLVVALPPTAGGPLARWQDALIGSATAVAVAVTLPADPRRLPRARLVAVAAELTVVLEELAEALRAGDAARAERVLDRARAAQPLVEAALAAARGSQEVTRIAPLRRRHAAESARLARAAQELERAVLNARVLARRAARAVDDGRGLRPEADVLLRLAGATRTLRSDLADGGVSWRARPELLAVAAELSPRAAAGRDGQGAAVVAHLRPLVVDLVEATGMDAAAARAALPPS